MSSESPPAKLIIIGIDLGTTNSLASVVFEHGPEALRPKGGEAVIPSVLTRLDGQWIVGQQAREHRTTHPEQTVFSVKRLMGRDIDDLKNDLVNLPYQVEAAQRGLTKVVVDGEGFTPQEISAEILKAVKLNAEAALGHPVEKAVVTVPAYFDDAQRQATRDAGRIAGLEVVRIINEPTAAAIAYGLDEKLAQNDGEGPAKDRVVAVYDLGGGTFDISVLTLSAQVFKVLSTHGDTHLGGDDFDMAISEEITQRIHAKHPDLDLSDPLSAQLLRKVAELVKIDLSGAMETEFQIDLPSKNLNFSGRFTREELEGCIQPFVDVTLESCRAALKAAGKKPEEMDEIVLVGGSSRVPLVRHAVEEFFGKKPNVAINPEEVVAVGAAIQGHLLSGGRRDYVLLDVTPLALGIETLGGTFSKLIMANTTIPAKAEELFTTSTDNQTGVDVNIYQGEREFVRDCRSLGRFRLKGIPAMPAGLPKVNVTFLVDTNGILTVSAIETRSGQTAQIDVIPSHGLTNDEVDTIIEDSLEHAMDDLNMRQMVEFRNTAEAVFKGVEKVWNEARGMVGEEGLELISTQMNQVREAAKGTNPIALKGEMDKLGELTRPLADAIMSQAALAELKNFFSEHKQ